MSPICAAVGWGHTHFSGGQSRVFAGWWGMETSGEEKSKVPYELIRGYFDAFEVLLWIGIAQAYLA